MTREQHVIAAMGRQLSRALDDLVSSEADRGLMAETIQTLQSENAELKKTNNEPQA